MVASQQIIADSALRCTRLSRVEERRGGLGHAATLRFLSPLIEPDLLISNIRLSDWLHREALDVGPRCTLRRRNTPSGPKIWPSENFRVPRPCTLCRRVRKCLARS